MYGALVDMTTVAHDTNDTGINSKNDNAVEIEGDYKQYCMYGVLLLLL